MSIRPREALLEAYRAAIAAVEGRGCTARWLAAHPPGPGKWYLLALGKAAAAMTRGALDVLGASVQRGLVVTREGYGDADLEQDPRIRVLFSAHPVPDRRSLAAGEAVVRFMETAPEDAAFLVLVSGGASSLLERLPEGVGVEALQSFNRALLASGLDIGAMNRARKAVSRIKGGRLARHLRGRRALALLISDVPGDRPETIGSGPLFPDPDPATALSPELAAICPLAPPAPPPDDAVFASVEAHVGATNAAARRAAASALERGGIPARAVPELLQGDAVQRGPQLLDELLAGPRGAVVWGGEPTVVLPERPGRGGRMQALALAAAVRGTGRPDWWLLAGGTDGADGPGDDAGALVDGGTVERGRAGGGGDPAGALERADAGRFLAASGDLLRTGSTGTNVMDVVIGLHDP